jgi:hypothetical protein
MDRTQRARLRFEDMLISAELAAEWAALGRPGVDASSTLTPATSKAMNRAGGFLEAISIVIPDLGSELLDEFENFAARLETQSVAAQSHGDRRIAEPGGSRSDRRAWDRRLRHERRRQSMAMAVERRLTPSRRSEPDRRVGKVRELADRRWRAGMLT